MKNTDISSAILLTPKSRSFPPRRAAPLRGSLGDGTVLPSQRSIVSEEGRRWRVVGKREETREKSRKPDKRLTLAEEARGPPPRPKAHP